jgi:hypothetical protein
MLVRLMRETPQLFFGAFDGEGGASLNKMRKIWRILAPCVAFWGLLKWETATLNAEMQLFSYLEPKSYESWSHSSFGSIIMWLRRNSPFAAWNNSEEWALQKTWTDAEWNPINVQMRRRSALVSKLEWELLCPEHCWNTWPRAIYKSLVRQ